MSAEDVRGWVTLAFVGVGVLLSAFGAIHSYRARKAAEATKGGIVEVGGKLYSLDKRVDGRLTDLLASVRAEAITEANLARAQGHADGEQAQRDRAAEAQQ